MIPVIIAMAVMVYIMIGGFCSGAFEREVRPIWVLFWPILLVILAVFIIARIPAEYGKKYYIAIDKWFEKILK